MKKNVLRGLLTTALIGASALVPGVVSTASAQPTGAQVVTFGDSFSANGGADPLRTENSRVANPQCRTDVNNWPKVAARSLGKSIADYTCNGSSFPMSLGYATAALQSGDIGPATEEVILMYGGLDPLFYVDAAAGLAGAELPISPYQGLIALFQKQIKDVAPNARVTLLSYPRMVDGDKICPALGLPVPAPGGSALEAKINDSVRVAARNIGANFIDVYAASEGHGPCAPGAERWVNILNKLDFLGEPESIMPNHPTDAGHFAIGEVVANGLR